VELYFDGPLLFGYELSRQHRPVERCRIQRRCGFKRSRAGVRQKMIEVRGPNDVAVSSAQEGSQGKVALCRLHAADHMIDIRSAVLFLRISCLEES
jgi:hypothetical protein